MLTIAEKRLLELASSNLSLGGALGFLTVFNHLFLCRKEDLEGRDAEMVNHKDAEGVRLLCICSSLRKDSW